MNQAGVFLRKHWKVVLFIVGLLVALGMSKGIVWYCKKHNITME